MQTKPLIKTAMTLTLLLLLGISPHLSAKTLLVFGDSFSTGYGLKGPHSWVELLKKHIDAEHQVVNASKNGRLLTKSALDLEIALEDNSPDIVILALGINDGNQKIRLSKIRRELRVLIESSQESGAAVVVFSAFLPPPADHARAFNHQQLFFEQAYEMDVAYLEWVNQYFFSSPLNLLGENWHPSISAHEKLFLSAQKLLAEEFKIDFKPALRSRD